MFKSLTVLFIVVLSLAAAGCLSSTHIPQIMSDSEWAKLKDDKVRLIVRDVEQQLFKVKGYSAKVERQILDPNGGFNKFIEEQTVLCPDKMRIKGKVVAAHNKSNIGNNIDITIDGVNLYSRFGHRSYDRSFKKIEQAGGPSLRMYMAYLGNLTDPFTLYRVETLKLVNENENEWVLTAQYKKLQRMPYWLPRWLNRVTIDKKNGCIKKIEAVIKELPAPVILLKVKKLSTYSDMNDVPAVFKSIKTSQ